jgi:hypothetical protein
MVNTPVDKKATIQSYQWKVEQFKQKVVENNALANPVFEVGSATFRCLVKKNSGGKYNVQLQMAAGSNPVTFEAR